MPPDNGTWRRTGAFALLLLPPQDLLLRDGRIDLGSGNSRLHVCYCLRLQLPLAMLFVLASSAVMVSGAVRVAE